MNYFYILFCVTLLLLSKYTLKIKLLLVGIVVYVSYITWSGVFNVEEYVIISTIFLLTISILLFDNKNKITSTLEILSIISFKFIELMLIVYPITYAPYLTNYYIYMDDMFISALLFVLFSREVGYHPFKMDKQNLRKYILTAVISYLTVIFLI